VKSERLKKLESELNDLEQWMKLGLVPKKELERHQDEIQNLKARIEEEKERLQFLKESGDLEEYTAPRRSPAKTVYPETPSMSDVEFGESTEAALEMETEPMELETTEEEREERTTAMPEEEVEEEEEEDEEDPFSDRNRWRRGGIIDPDAVEW
jgi:DNA mismatch repair ATPase MutS